MKPFLCLMLRVAKKRVRYVAAKNGKVFSSGLPFCDEFLIHCFHSWYKAVYDGAFRTNERSMWEKAIEKV